MPPVRSISVLLPILNGARYLDRVLSSLARQQISIPWDFLALDCGSTDGTLEILDRHAQAFPVPLRVQGILKEEFNHGCTRNMLAARSTGELLVFITDDAIPMKEDWLAKLAANFEDPRVAGAYCRNITRPEADTLVRLGNQHDPAYDSERREERIDDREAYERMGPEQRRLLFNYCDSASALRRDLWQRHPYIRCTFAEDVMQSKAFLEAGYTVVFDVASPIEHSHDFDLVQAFARSAVDGECNAELLGRVGVPTQKVADRMARQQVRVDLKAFRAEGLRTTALLQRVAYSRKLRKAQFSGMYEGGRSLRRWRYTALLSEAELSAAVVVASGASASVRERVQLLVGAMKSHGVSVSVMDEGAPGASARELTERFDVVHLHSPGRSTLPLLTDLLARDAAVLVHYHETAEAMGDPEVLFAGRRAALALAGSSELRARLRSDAGYHPAEVALSPERRGHEERDLDELAGELAFRYRQVACRRGQSTPDELASMWAGEASVRTGDLREAALGALVLGPGHAAVEFVLPRLELARCDLIVHVGFTGLAKGERPAGRILAGGQPLARFGPLEPRGPAEKRSPTARGETIVLSLGLRTTAGLERLRIENRLTETGPPQPLRLETLVIQRRTIDTRRPVDGLGHLSTRLGRMFEFVPSMVP
jgi:rhamnosyltransferase